MRSTCKVLHVITDLGQGGAEAVLYRLICSVGTGFEHAVVSLHGEGVYGEALRMRGISVTALGMRRGRLSWKGVRQLRQVMSDYRPHVVQTRLDHANLVGGLGARFTGAPPVVWAVHSTDLGPLRSSWKTRIVRRICALLSYSVPRVIVSDARSGADLHANIGFSASKLMVVPNGVDPSAFRPDTEARDRVRSLWGVSPEETLIGCVARWDPLKDHENLLHAVRLLADRGYAFRCALVGRGMGPENQQLQQMVDRWAIGSRLILAGPTNDVASFMNALDIHVLPSRAESLPVAVIEAMACGIPCVVTDVGDARYIVGDTGWVGRPQDPAALADALQAALLAHKQDRVGKRATACRDRVIRNFSLASMSAEYAALWTRMAQSAVRAN